MRYCVRCLYPANHPYGIIFDSHGVCSGCRIHEEKDRLNWREREGLLRGILKRAQARSGVNFDCVVTVTGGGDSYFMVHTVKSYGLNPLLVSYNHEYNTKRGLRNLANLATAMDCDLVTYTLDPELLKRLTRHTLRKFGSMYWHCLAGFLTFPVQVAVKFKIPLIVWGVHPWSEQVGMFSHLDEVEMTERCRREHGLMRLGAEDLIDEASGITRRDVQPFVYPYDNELEAVGIRGIYLSNYIRWDSKAQHERMIEEYGYESAPQERTFNTYEDVHCFHSAGVHDYIKFLKYGYSKVTDHASREIRLRRMSREEGMQLVQQYSAVEPRDLPMLLRWLEISHEEFRRCVWSRRDPVVWQAVGKDEYSLRDSVVNHVDDPGVDAARLEQVEDCAFIVTPSREPYDSEQDYLLMGRGYLDRLNFGAVEDRPAAGHHLAPRVTVAGRGAVVRS